MTLDGLSLANLRALDLLAQHIEREKTGLQQKIKTARRMPWRR